MEYACNQRTFFGNARLLFHDACEGQHLVPAAERIPHGAGLFLHFVADLQVGGNHLLQDGFLVGIDREGVGVGEQVTFE